MLLTAAVLPSDPAFWQSWRWNGRRTAWPLGIKPVVTLENGAVTMIGKARGSKQGNNLLVQKVRESGGIDFSLPILLGYTGLSDALLQKYVADSAALWRDHCGSLEQTLLCSVIGTHTGPGVVAVAFFKNGV